MVFKKKEYLATNYLSLTQKIPITQKTLLK